MTKKSKPGSFQMTMDFMRSYPWRSFLMVICLAFSGFSEGVGFASLLPLLNLAVGKTGAGMTPLGKLIAQAYHTVGMQPSPGILLFIVAAAIALKSGFKLLAMQQVGYNVAHVVTDLRLRMIQALMKARWEYFINKPIGIFTNAISSETMRLVRGYKQTCLIMAEVIQVTFYLALAVLISWHITLGAILVGCFITVSLRPLVKAVRLAGALKTKSFEALLVRLTDLLSGIKPIKAMGRENQLGPFLEAESVSIKKALQREVLGSEALKTLQEPILAVFLAIGLYLVLTYSEVPMTTLLVMAFLFNRSVVCIGKLQKQYQTVAESESAYWSFRDKLQELESATEIIEGKIIPKFREEIRFENVDFSYDEKEVIKEASFSIPYGKLTVITGASGVGKTTIVDLIAGLVKPTSGAIKVDSLSLAEIDLKAWRRMIGYVPQEIFLFHESVLDNIALGDKRFTRHEIEDALHKAGALDFVSALRRGVDTVIGERGSKLSGGQRQRIALARALVQGPKLLILDEVTSALDPETEAAICSTMLELRGNMAILAISHQQALIDAADLVYQVEKGRVQRVEFSQFGAYISGWRTNSDGK
jgi:ATP-binding cassette subfamily C protein